MVWQRWAPNSPIWSLPPWKNALAEMPSLSETFVTKLPSWKVSEVHHCKRERSEVKCPCDPPVWSIASAMAIEAEMCPTLASQARISTLKFHSFWKHPLARPYFLCIQMMSEPAIHFKAFTSPQPYNISCHLFQNYSQDRGNIFSLWGTCRLVTSPSSGNHRWKLALLSEVSCQMHQILYQEN